MKIILYSPAKINLSLDVIGKRADGYHELSTIMQTINLYDEIVMNVRRADSSEGALSFSSNFSFIPNDESNLIIKAVRAYEKASCITVKADIKALKRIPVGAGLGGGSSNAAYVLMGLSKALSPLDDETLYKTAASLGADVPFFLKGGTCLAKGIGDILEPIDYKCRFFYLVHRPPFPMSTPLVFAKYAQEPSVKHPDTSSVVKALACGNSNMYFQNAANVLEKVAESLNPGIFEIKQRMLSCGADFAIMSGSGSAVIGLFSSKSTAVSALEIFRKSKGYTYVCQYYPVTKIHISQI